MATVRRTPAAAATIQDACAVCSAKGKSQPDLSFVGFVGKPSVKRQPPESRLRPRFWKFPCHRALDVCGFWRLPFSIPLSSSLELSSYQNTSISVPQRKRKARRRTLSQAPPLRLREGKRRRMSPPLSRAQREHSAGQGAAPSVGGGKVSGGGGEAPHSSSKQSAGGSSCARLQNRAKPKAQSPARKADREGEPPPAEKGASEESEFDSAETASLSPEEEERRVRVTASKISVVVSRQQVHLKRCYQNAAKSYSPKEPLAGRILVSFRLMPDGSAQEVQVTKNTSGSPVLANCLTSLVKGWTFPSPGEVPLDFLWPFEFQAP